MSLLGSPTEYENDLARGSLFLTVGGGTGKGETSFPYGRLASKGETAVRFPFRNGLPGVALGQPA